jgi:hypothetical protein
MLDINLATFQREAQRTLTDEKSVKAAVARFKKCDKAEDRVDERLTACSPTNQTWKNCKLCINGNALQTVLLA